MRLSISLVAFLLLTMYAHGQFQKEIQLRSGLGWGIYKTTWSLDYHYTNGNINLERDTSGAVTVQLPIDIRYTLNKRLTVGLDIKSGHYVYGDSIASNVVSRSNHFGIIGLSAEFNIVARPNFRWYVGTGLNSSKLTINQTTKSQNSNLEESLELKGPGVRLNTGLLAYFGDSPIGFLFQIGYDSHSYDLKTYSRNQSAQDISYVTGRLQANGIDGTLGLVMRIRPGRQASKSN